MLDEAATVIYENTVSEDVAAFVADNTEDYVSKTLIRMKGLNQEVETYIQVKNYS